MALMHAMYAAHTSAEAAMKRILDILGEDHPTGDDWHNTLIERLAEPGAAKPNTGQPSCLPRSPPLCRRRAAFATVRRIPTMTSMGSALRPLEAARVLVDLLEPTVVNFKRNVDPD